jgi:hypothetical protein
LVINIKSINECKWDPINLIFMYYVQQHLFCKYWPDDGPMRPKLVVNSNITIKLYSCVRLSTYVVYFIKCTLNTTHVLYQAHIDIFMFIYIFNYLYTYSYTYTYFICVYVCVVCIFLCVYRNFYRLQVHGGCFGQYLCLFYFRV